MKQPLSQELLDQVARTVLEEAAFLFAEVTQGAAEWPEQVIVATLELTGPAQSRISVTVPPALALQFASNLIGDEIADTADYSASRDATGELLNMMSGSLARAWWGGDANCDLSAPESRMVSSKDASFPQPGDFAVTFVVDDSHPMQLVVTDLTGPTSSRPEAHT